MNFPLPTLRSLFTRKAILPRARGSESFRARLGCERLETRAMLAADSLSAWHNFANAYDVNNDGRVTALDALNVVNALNTGGSRDLTQVSSGAVNRSMFMTAASQERVFYLDVNGDSMLTARDALTVINKLNAAQGEQVRIRLEVTDTAGDPITGPISLGETFLVRGHVKDLREPEGLPGDDEVQRGVYGAYVDVTFDDARLNVAGMITHPSPYTGNPEGTVRPDLIDNVGAISSDTNPLGSSERLLFVIPFTAVAAGTVSFGVGNDNSELHEVLVYGSDVEVPDTEIEYVGIQSLTLGTPPDAVDDIITTTINEDAAPVNLDVLANDTVHAGGQGPLTIALASVTTPGAGSVSISNGTMLVYTPAPNFSGPVQINYTIRDANNESDTANVSLTVTEVNDDPTAVNDTAEVDVGSADNVIDVLANDTAAPDVNETLSVVSVANFSQGGSAQIVANQVLYTPAAGFTGTETFEYTISDGRGGMDVATVTVTVTDEGPIARPDSLNIVEDTADHLIDVLANDELRDPLAGPLEILSIGPRSNGGTAFEENNQIRYSPAPNFAGTETFTYTVSDAQNRTATATVTVTVANVNDGPTAVDDTVAVNEDNPTVIDVRANDTDPDPGDTLRISVVTTAQNGVVSNTGTQLIYTPASNYTGPDSFTYTIRDVQGETSTATVNITVNPVNDPPPVVNDDLRSQSILEDSTNNSLDVLANDLTLPNPDGAENFVINAVTLLTPANGSTVQIAADGKSVLYTPGPNFQGEESFTYTTTDGTSTSAAATVMVRVTNVNDLPTLGADTATVAEDSDFTVIDVLANDSSFPDPAETLTVTAVTQPTNGTVTLTGGVIRYRPNANFQGADTFTYTVDDGTGETATANVTVTVTDTNDPPVAVNDTATIAEDAAPIEIDVVANDTTGVDPAGNETLSVQAITSAPTKGTASLLPNGRIRYTPSLNANGADTFTYQLRDSRGGTATGTVNITITPVNDNPPIANDTFNVNEDSSNTTLDVLANDLALANPDGQETITITAVGTGDRGGTITRAANNLSLIYTPAANFAGQETFTYTISDGNGGMATATVTVNVANMNDNPTAVDDTATVDRDSANNVINVLANDLITPDQGETLTITAVSAGSQGGTITIAPDNRSVRYTPAAGFSGTETFTYTISDGNGGSDTGAVTVTVRDITVTAGSISGFVYVDVDNDGVKDSVERPLEGVRIVLSGRTTAGQNVSMVAMTDANGRYIFEGVMEGTYTITEEGPEPYIDGQESMGSSGGTMAADQFFLELGNGENATDYNFGERGLKPEWIGRPLFFYP